MTPLRTALLGAAALCAAGCIERPPRDAQQGSMPAPRQEINRAALRGVFVQQLPPDLVQVGAVFGNAIELLGYRLEPPALVPGQPARVTFFWRCRAPLSEAWHIFVHLDDATGSGARINQDHDPAGGRYPTDAWRPGEVIADPIVFPVDRFPLMLFVGLYTQGETRLQLTANGRGRNDGHDRLLAGILPLAK